MDNDYTYKQMKAADHVPTHLGRGALHTRRPPPRQIISEAPSKRYPDEQENVRISPTPKLNPILLPNCGIPGSSQGSRLYSENKRASQLVQVTTTCFLSLIFVILQSSNFCVFPPINTDFRFKNKMNA